MAQQFTVKAVDAMRNVTLNVRVKGIRRLAARMWVGMGLMRLAAWVVGCGIQIETKGTKKRKAKRCA